MMVGYYWCWKRKDPEATHKKKEKCTRKVLSPQLKLIRQTCIVE